MSAFRGNFKFGKGTTGNRLLVNNEITAPPTKNCFIHFPVRSQSEDDDLLDKYISRSCPTSGILDTDASRNNGTADAPQTTVVEPTSGVTTQQEEETTTFPIALEISSNEPEGRLGLSVDYSSGREVRITAIEQGLIQEWNRMHSNRGERLVNIGDIIVSINGISDPVKMLQECRQQTPYVVEVIIKPLERPNPETAAKNGSAGHAFGICRPCAYYHKPNGCVNTQTCSYCHECPAGELKRRKQVKMFFRKMMYKIQRQQSGDASQDQLQDEEKC